MRKVGWIGLALVVSGGVAAIGAAQAGDTSSSRDKAPVDCRAPDAPYKKYDCLDVYLGDGFLERLINYYRLEWGHEKPPADPKAPSARRAGWPDAPTTTPPYPFTEWPYGGTTSIGVTRPASVDSPLMVALANTALGKTLNAGNMQIYGWINGGGNISSNTVKPGGNWPAAYDFTPNRDQLDQAVVYFERLPDTVQTDHVDWGFRLSAIYGENYRYTTAFGLASYQLLGHNLYNGYDFPMLYGELYLPQFGAGLLLRLGRFISIPDIEAQLAPNNYMYSHSMSYSFDNYTNTGLQSTLALNKNWFLQLGLTVGTEAMPWHVGQTVPNPFPNPVFPGNTMLKDPGAQPSITAGVRWQSDSGWDTIYVVADAVNNGTWGYNNLQWTGLTWYHRISRDWHFSWEMYSLNQKNVLNATDPAGIIANGGFPFTPANGFAFNAPFFAQCANPKQITCTAEVFATVMYLNYQFSPFDNISFRPEFYNDMEGQRTGTKTRYVTIGLGWQHWFSPQVELRPEVTYYRALDAPAFNGNFNANPVIPPTKKDALIVAADLIWHF
jgi:Putative beta-barrel porin-2, OmpL-like. bbp2